MKWESDVCPACKAPLPLFVCALLLLGVAVRAGAEPFLAAPSLCFDAGVGAFSVVAHDLNGDGHLDLVTQNPEAGSVSVLLSDGFESFLPKTDYATGKGWPLAVGDLNSDGHADLIAVRADSILVLLGIGDGTFPPALSQQAGGGPSGFAVADLNHDGHEDVAMSMGGGHVGGVSILFGNGDGTFAPPMNYSTGGYPRTIAAGDLNGDGEVDLVVGQGGGTSNAILLMLGKRDGTFAEPGRVTTQIFSPSLALADLNSDGRLDLIVLSLDNYSHNLAFVLLGNGDGTFGPAVAYGAGDETYGYGGFVIGDLNTDGHPDLAVPDFGRSEVAVVPGTGDGTFGPVQRFPIGSNPLSTVIGDFNGDGRPDIAAACSAGGNNLGMVSVLLGNANGIFGVDRRVITGADPSAIEVKDLNGDDYPDIVSANFNSASVSVAINRGDGQFEQARDYDVGPYPVSIASGELDGAPGLDLVVADYGSDSVSILPGRVDGTFASQRGISTLSNPNVVCIADLDGDGRPDLTTAAGDGFYICFPTSRPAPKLGRADVRGISVQFGLGHGTFGGRTDIPFGRFPNSISAADFDDDGNLDLAIADPLAQTVTLLPGMGNGTFGPPVDVLVGIPANTVLAHDVNGDGKQDLIVAHKAPCDLTGGVTVFKGNGDGTFALGTAYTTPGGSYWVALGDLDGDGKSDLATANGTSTVSILFGASDGSFHSRVDFGTGLYPSSVGIGDLDGDGRPDLVVGSALGNSVSLLFNLGGRPVLRTAAPRDRGWIRRIYPVPARTKFTIIAAAPRGGSAVVDIFSPQGQLLQSVRFDGLSIGLHPLDVDVSGLASGIYPILYRDPTGTRVRGRSKIVVLR